MSTNSSLDVVRTDRCPVCEHTFSENVFAVNGFNIVQCKSCTTQFVCPMPSEDDLRVHYEDPAYFRGEGHQGYANYGDMRKALVPHFRRRLAAITRYQSTRGRLLDLGCAAGYFLEVAKSDGWQISGVELSNEMALGASRLLGITVANSLDTVSERDFDAITLWEVIEHLPDPVVELRKLYDLLRPGGLLMLSTPNVGHWLAVRERELWHAYCPPSHLVYFTRRTLTDLLATVGFERIEVRKVSPLPPLPGWLRKLSAPLAGGLATGQARSWPVALVLWRAVRLFGLSWWALAHRDDDVFATLEATAFRTL